MQFYNEKEQAEQGKIESDSLRRKGALGSIIELAKSYAQGDQKFKEKPDPKWSKGSGDLRAGPHPVKLPVCKKELKA